MTTSSSSEPAFFTTHDPPELTIQLAPITPSFALFPGDDAQLARLFMPLGRRAEILVNAFAHHDSS
jgi:hypothetical protein